MLFWPRGSRNDFTSALWLTPWESMKITTSLALTKSSPCLWIGCLICRSRPLHLQRRSQSRNRRVWRCRSGRQWRCLWNSPRRCWRHRGSGWPDSLGHRLLLAELHLHAQLDEGDQVSFSCIVRLPLVVVLDGPIGNDLEQRTQVIDKHLRLNARNIHRLQQRRAIGIHGGIACGIFHRHMLFGWLAGHEQVNQVQRTRLGERPRRDEPFHAEAADAGIDVLRLFKQHGGNGLAAIAQDPFPECLHLLGGHGEALVFFRLHVDGAAHLAGMHILVAEPAGLIGDGAPPLLRHVAGRAAYALLGSLGGLSANLVPEQRELALGGV